MISILNKPKVKVLTRLLCSAYLLVTWAQVAYTEECEGELAGVGAERGWINAEGIGYADAPEQRTERAFQDALDQLIQKQLLLDEASKARYQANRNNLLQNYQNFIIKTDNQPFYCILEKGKNEQGKRYTQVRVYFDRNKIVKELEQSKVIDSVKNIQYKVVFIPKDLNKLANSNPNDNESQALDIFYTILSDRGFKVISLQEIQKLLKEDQQLKNLLSKQTSYLSTASRIQQGLGAEALIIYDLVVKVDADTKYDIFYRSDLSLELIDTRTNKVSIQKNYPGASIGLPKEGANQTIQNAAILSTLRPVADQIAQTLLQHWQRERKQGIDFRITLVKASQNKLTEIKNIFKSRCSFTQANLQEINLRCQFKEDETFDDYWINKVAKLGKISNPPYQIIFKDND